MKSGSCFQFAVDHISPEWCESWELSRLRELFEVWRVAANWLRIRVIWVFWLVQRSATAIEDPPESWAKTVSSPCLTVKVIVYLRPEWWMPGWWMPIFNRHSSLVITRCLAFITRHHLPSLAITRHHSPSLAITRHHSPSHFRGIHHISGVLFPNLKRTNDIFKQARPKKWKCARTQWQRQQQEVQHQQPTLTT